MDQDLEVLTLRISGNKNGRQLSPSSLDPKFLLDIAKAVDLLTRKSENVVLSLEHGSFLMKMAVGSALAANIFLAAGAALESHIRNNECDDIGQGIRRLREISRKDGYHVELSYNGKTLNMSPEDEAIRSSSFIVRCRKEIVGKAVTAGGNKKNKIIVKTARGEEIEVAIRREDLENFQGNVFKQNLHILVEYDFEFYTGKSKKYRFVDFLKTKKLTENSLREFREREKENWRDVSDPVKWQNDMRSGEFI